MKEVRKSKLAIVSFILGLLSILLSIPFATIAVILSIASIVNITRSDKQLIGIKYAVVGIVFSLLSVFLFVLWLCDTPPVADDYTIRDLHSANPKYHKSYKFVEKLHTGKSDIGLFESDLSVIYKVTESLENRNYVTVVKIINNNAESINNAWIHAKIGKAIIVKLNSYPEIADLSKPSMNPPSCPEGLVDMTCLYSSFLCLQTLHGNIHNYMDEFSRIHSVINKIQKYSRYYGMQHIINKCELIMLYTANFMICCPKTDEKVLQYFKSEYKPLRIHPSLLHNAIIYEYLTMKNEWNKYEIKTWRPLRKHNSLLRLKRNICNKCLNKIGAHKIEDNRVLNLWPLDILKNIPSHYEIDDGSYMPSWIYRIYNPVGSKYQKHTGFSWERLFTLVENRKKYIDKCYTLFQIVLSKRLDYDYHLHDDFGYTIDEANRMIYCQGIDRNRRTIMMFNPIAIPNNISPKTNDSDS